MLTEIVWFFLKSNGFLPYFLGTTCIQKYSKVSTFCWNKSHLLKLRVQLVLKFQKQMKVKVLRLHLFVKDHQISSTTIQVKVGNRGEIFRQSKIGICKRRFYAEIHRYLTCTSGEFQKVEIVQKLKYNRRCAHNI